MGTSILEEVKGLRQDMLRVCDWGRITLAHLHNEASKDDSDQAEGGVEVERIRLSF
jgi:hypothetical protein